MTDCLWSQDRPVGLFKCLKVCHQEPAKNQILVSLWVDLAYFIHKGQTKAVWR